MSRPGLILVLLISLFLLSGKAYAVGPIWQIDSNYSFVKFTIANLALATCHGTVNSVYGRIDYQPNDLSTIKVHAEMEGDSLQTAIVKRDNHLKTKAFFDVPDFPIWTFQSTNIEPISPAHFKMKGKLKIKGIEKEVTLDCHGPSDLKPTQKGDKASFTAIAETKIDRRMFGVTGWSGLIGDVAKVTIRIRGVESTAAEAEDEFGKRQRVREKASEDHQKDLEMRQMMKK